MKYLLPLLPLLAFSVGCSQSNPEKPQKEPQSVSQALALMSAPASTPLTAPPLASVIVPPTMIAPPFNPIGQTEKQIVAKFGETTSRMELGDELTLIYPESRYTLVGGIVTGFEKPEKAPVSAPTVASNGSSGPNEANALYIQRLRDSLVDKQKELAAANVECDKKYRETVAEQSDSHDPRTRVSGYVAKSMMLGSSRDAGNDFRKEMKDKCGVTQIEGQIADINREIKTE